MNLVGKNRSKRAERRKRKMSDRRSPYAKSLELKQYRHRVEKDKRLSFDDWVEDALAEYYQEKENGIQINAESTPTKEGEDTNTDTTDSQDRDVRTDGEVVHKEGEGTTKEIG